MNPNFYKQEANDYLKNKKCECSHIEYKASEHQLDKILKTICAYGNNYYDNEYSFIYIGVEEVNNEKEKSIPLLPIKGIDEAHLEIAKNTLNSLKSYIYPNVKYEVFSNKFEKKTYLLIVVERQNGGPFQVTEKALNNKKINLKPGRYIRIESDSRIAKIHEEYDLLRKFANYHFSSDVNNNATIDDLDFDYMKEYLKSTSNRYFSDSLSKDDIAKMLNLFSYNEYSTNRVKNFAVLMFAKNPDEFIPYSFIEVITNTLGSTSRMEAKNFKGPIWKQYYASLKYIEDYFIRTITLREDNTPINKKISNFPFKAVEELLANAIVHKNYEEYKTVQVYITNEEINIINYNKPLPPITLEDLNTRTIFKERDSVNPEIRDMFKDLGIIESYGTGIGKAKKACELNKSQNIYYKIFDDNVNVTSVIIPCSEEYLALTGQKKINEEKNYELKDGKVHIQNKIKNSSLSLKIKNNLDKTYLALYDIVFSPKDIINLLGVSPNTATKYINKLKELDLIEKVKGMGQSKYKFKKD